MAFGTYPQYYPPQYPYYTQPAMQDQLAQLRAAQPTQQTSNGLIWVQGEAGAKSYLVANGASVLLMDSERQTFYIKSADASGMPSMRIFDYTERAGTPIKAPDSPQDAPKFATREEVEAIAKRLETLENRRKKGVATDESAV